MRCSICSIVASLSLLLTCGALCAQSGARAEPSGKEVEPTSIEQLLARLHGISGMTAVYDEEKHIALLKRPLQSHGRLYFAAPNLLLRKVERPEPSALLLQGETLQISDASGTRRVDLQQSGTLRQFVLTFVYVLAGNRSALGALYDLRFSPRKTGGWSLELVPKQADLKRFITRAELEGHSGVVDRMSLQESNGDATDLRFSQVDLNAHFDQAARVRIFRLAEP